MTVDSKSHDTEVGILMMIFSLLLLYPLFDYVNFVVT